MSSSKGKRSVAGGKTSSVKAITRGYETTASQTSVSNRIGCKESTEGLEEFGTALGMEWGIGRIERSQGENSQHELAKKQGAGRSNTDN